MNRARAGELANMIMADISNRKGLSDELDGIEESIKDEMVDEWAEIILDRPEPFECYVMVDENNDILSISDEPRGEGRTIHMREVE